MEELINTYFAFKEKAINNGVIACDLYKGYNSLHFGGPELLKLIEEHNLPYELEVIERLQFPYEIKTNYEGVSMYALFTDNPLEKKETAEAVK